MSRGWAPIPIPFKSKRPRLDGWQNLRISDGDLPRYFNGQPQNVGVLMGEPSGWLIDVDLDHPEAVRMAPEFLPPTQSIFGRASKRASHWLYRVTAPASTTRLSTTKRTTIVELRSTGAQTVLPGSIHESGEPVEWDTDDEPATVKPTALIEALNKLAAAVAESIGEPLKIPTPALPPAAAMPAPGSDRVRRARAYLAKLPPAVSGQGGHDQTLQAACECFRFGLTGAEALDVLTEYNARCVPPWTPKDLAHKITDARAKVEAEGRTGARLVEQRPAVQVTSREFPPTDTGNAERFAHQFGDRARYVGQWGKWLIWSGVGWQRDETGEAEQLGKQVVRSIYAEANRQEDIEKRAKLGAWAAASENASKRRAMLRLAQSEPPIAITPAELDSDPWLFNTITGTIDLRSGDVRPHDPRDLITKLAPVEYDTGAKCPAYDWFMKRILAADVALQVYVERLLGYCLTGDIRHHHLPIAWGAGANGKSTLFDLVLSIFGDYAAPAADSLVTQRASDEHPTELADCAGRRLLIASETDEGRKLRIGTVKKLTGDAVIKGRFMRGDYFTFQRTHKLILVTNNRPRVSEDSNAVWRRLRLIPFTVIIPDAEQDRALPDRLRAEAPGILARWVRACLEWQRSGFDLAEPPAVREATAGYRSNENVIADFVESECLLNSYSTVTRRELWQAYQRWTERERIPHPLGQHGLYERIAALEGVTEGNVPADGRHRLGFRGIGLCMGVPTRD